MQLCWSRKTIQRLQSLDTFFFFFVSGEMMKEEKRVREYIINDNFNLILFSPSKFCLSCPSSPSKFGASESIVDLDLAVNNFFPMKTSQKYLRMTSLLSFSKGGHSLLLQCPNLDK